MDLYIKAEWPKVLYYGSVFCVSYTQNNVSKFLGNIEYKSSLIGWQLANNDLRQYEYA